MADLIGRVSKVVLVACALPLYVRRKVEDLIDADTVTMGLADLRRRAEGERDEARANAALAMGARDACRQSADIAVRQRELARDELRIATAELDAARADVQDLTARLAVVTRSCLELQCDLDTARATRNDEQRFRLAAEGEVKRMRENLNAVIEQRDAEARKSIEASKLLHAAECSLSTMTKMKDHAEEQVNAARVSLADMTTDRDYHREQIAHLRRETKWPDGNDASWIVNLIADKDKANAALATDRDLVDGLAKRWRDRFIDAADNLALTYPIGWQAIVERDAARANEEKLGMWLSETIRRAEKAEAELAALRKPAESTATALRDHGAPPCAHCLRPVDRNGYMMGDGSGDVSKLLDICAACVDVDDDVIRARVAIRAASCPVRRVSPDPLAITCETCRRAPGYPCVNRETEGAPRS